MKKMVALFFVMCLMLSACGTSTASDESGKQTESSESTNQNIENDLQSSEDDVQDSEKEVVDGEVPYVFRDMLPVMDAFMMYAVEYNNFEYDAADPEVFWGILYYTIGNYAGNSQYAEIDGDYLRVDRMLVQEYAAGQFAEYDDLPEVPEVWENNIIYDADWDAYKFAVGDRGLSSAEIVGWTELNDGTYDVTARLFGLTDNQTITEVKFHLVKNKYADGITNPMFMYAIDTVENVGE